MAKYSIRCGESGNSASNNAANAAAYGTSYANGDDYSHPQQRAPYAWVAPKDVEITEETTFTWFASPYNPGDVGIVPLHKNAVESVIEVSKQLPPSFSYEGPVAGAGFLDLFAPKPGSAKYNAYVLGQQTKEIYNPKTLGITPLAENAKTAGNEIITQTEGPSLWEKFSTGLVQGYTKEPEDVNVFGESVANVGKALTGIASPSNYYLLGIAGAVLLLILIIK
jgi:hypothetical protein